MGLEDIHISQVQLQNENENITNKNCTPPNTRHERSQFFRYWSPHCRCEFYPLITYGQTNWVK